MSDPYVLPAPDPAPASPLPEAQRIVPGDGWWPDVDLVEIRDSYRIGEDVTQGRLRTAVRDAMLSVWTELAAWRAAQTADSLAEVSAAEIDDKPIAVVRYLTAVGCRAKALLVDRNRDIDSTARGHDRAAELEPTAGDWRRDAAYAVRQLLGRSRIRSRLL